VSKVKEFCQSNEEAPGVCQREAFIVFRDRKPENRERTAGNHASQFAKASENGLAGILKGAEET